MCDNYDNFVEVISKPQRTIFDVLRDQSLDQCFLNFLKDEFLNRIRQEREDYSTLDDYLFDMAL
jgi:hypothetical protein